MREGCGGSEGGAPSVFCSGACGGESLLETGGLTEGQTAVGRSRGLELVRDREIEGQKKIVNMRRNRQTSQTHDCY